MTERASYKIIELRSENIKRLKAVAIRPDGNMVQITGRNSNGKTSVLDSIWWALAGKRAIQRNPIRKGCETALIKLDLGEIKVTRTFTATEDGDYTTNLKVVMADGSRPSKEQDLLNAICGELTFGPSAFSELKADEQFEALKGFVPGIDFAALARADKADFDERTAVNRRAKELRAQAEGITLPPGKIPARVDIGSLSDRMAKAADDNAMLERRKAQRQALEADISRWKTQAVLRREEAQKLLDQATDFDECAKKEQAKIDAADALPAPVDVSDIRAQLATAQETNAAVERAERRAALEKEADAAEAKSKALTKAMEDREAQKQAAIAKAKMPVEGLGFGDGIVTLRGVPFDQASDAEQLEAAVAIAAAMNPDLRVIRVRDGSKMDKAAMVRLAAFADKYDMQIWVEKVTEGEDIGFVLEDGYLKGEAPEPIPAADPGDVV